MPQTKTKDYIKRLPKQPYDDFAEPASGIKCLKHASDIHYAVANRL